MFDQRNKMFDQLIQSNNQMTHRIDPLDDKIGTLNKANSTTPSPYNPQEPIVPRYEPSSNLLSLSHPEPYTIDTPRF